MNKSIGNKTTNPITKRLKKARNIANISQKKLGIAAGIDEFSASARMNQYEIGKHVPDFSTLARIAKVLNVHTAYFYTEDDTLAEIIMAYGQLNRKNKIKLLDIIKNLK